MSSIDNPATTRFALLAEVGLITLSWNNLEETLERLIWHYVGNPEKGHVVTSLLGNGSRCEALNALCAHCEAHPGIQEHVGRFAAAFDILRLNRNTIVHAASVTLTREGNAIYLERLKKSKKAREYETLKQPISAFSDLSEQIGGLTEYGETLLEIMRKRAGLIEQPFFDWAKPPPWPDKFPLPDKMS